MRTILVLALLAIATAALAEDPYFSVGGGYVFAQHEGELTAVEFVVTRSTAEGSARAQYRTSGWPDSALGTQFPVLSGFVDFAPGETRKDIVVPLFDDDTWHGPIQLDFNISSATTGYSVRFSVAHVRIIDNDVPVITFATNPVYVREGVGKAAIAIHARGKFLAPLPLRITGSMGSFTGINANVTLTPEQPVATFEVTVPNDDTRGHGKEGWAQLDLDHPWIHGLWTAKTTIHILEDDPVPILTIEETTFVESDDPSTFRPFTIRISPPQPEPIGFRLAARDLTARAHDYRFDSGDIYFGAGVTSIQAGLWMYGDDVPESEETFEVAVVDSGQPVITAPAKMRIADDDPPTDPALLPREVTGFVGESVTLELVRSTPAPQDITYSIGALNDRYLDKPASVKIPAGQTRGSFNVTIKSAGAHEVVVFLPDGGVAAARVNAEFKGFALDPAEPRTLIPGQRLTYTARSREDLPFVITATSSNPAVVRIDPGSQIVEPNGSVVFEVVALTPGSATITLSADPRLAPHDIDLQVVDAPLLTITSVQPGTVTTDGGTRVTITGTKFVAPCSVTFDGIAATNVSVVDTARIDATTPAHAAGAVDVAVSCAGASALLTQGVRYESPRSRSVRH